MAGAVQTALAAPGQRGDAGEAAPHGGIRAGPGGTAQGLSPGAVAVAAAAAAGSAPPASPALTPTPRAPLLPAARRAPCPAVPSPSAGPRRLRLAPPRLGTAGRGGATAAPPAAPRRHGDSCSAPAEEAPPRAAQMCHRWRDRWGQAGPSPDSPPPSSVPGTRTGAPRGGGRHRPVPAPRSLGGKHGRPSPQSTVQLRLPLKSQGSPGGYPEGQPQGQGHYSPPQPRRKAPRGVVYLHLPGRMLGWTSLTPAGPKLASPGPAQRPPSKEICG